MDTLTSRSTNTRTMLNKVPEVTIFFWIIKIMATTVERPPRLSRNHLRLGLTTTTFVMSGLLAVILAAQFRRASYRLATYWLVVVLLSIVGH